MKGRVLLAAILVCGTLLRLQDVTAPWVGRHNAWGGATYGHIARNYVTYGYLETRLAPVANFGLVPPDQFVYYYHYPPLLVWMVSLSYHAFGVSEASARLVPILFSVLSILVMYGLGRTLFDEAAARWAALLSAVVPIGVFYGAHVDVYGPPAQFFSLLAFLGYARMRRGDARCTSGLLLAAVVLGCLTSWYTYFALAAIAAHWLFWGERRPLMPRPVLAGAAAGAAIFLGILLHRSLVIQSAGQEIHATLWEKFLLRTSYGQLPVSVPALVAIHVKDLVRLYSPAVLLLAAVWGAGAMRRLWHRQLSGGDALVLAISGYGLAHALAFPSFLVNHDFMVGAYGGGIVLAAGATLAAALHRLRDARPSPAWGVTLVLIVVLSTLAFTQRLYRYNAPHEADSIKRYAADLRAATSPSDEILLATPANRVLEYYADRQLLFDVRSSADLANVGPARTRRFFACPSADTARPTICRDLAARLPTTVHGSIAVVRLDSTRPTREPRSTGLSPEPGGGR